MKREARIVSNGELRTTNEGMITGYAAVFNSLSEDLGNFRERMMPGAFRRTTKIGDVRMLINHDSNLILGRTKSGTLTLQEDSKGLKFDCEMPDTSYARDLLTSIGRGDVSQCSFAMVVVEDRWLNDGDGKIREVLDVDLFDISAVTYPAYPDTSVHARDLRGLFGRVSDGGKFGVYRTLPQLDPSFDKDAYIAGDPAEARKLDRHIQAMKDFVEGVR